jgi:hypothetical protein
MELHGGGTSPLRTQQQGLAATTTILAAAVAVAALAVAREEDAVAAVAVPREAHPRVLSADSVAKMATPCCDAIRGSTPLSPVLHIRQLSRPQPCTGLIRTGTWTRGQQITSPVSLRS